MGSRSGKKRNYETYIGGVEKIVYEEEVRGTTIIRTKFKTKKRRKKKYSK